MSPKKMLVRVSATYHLNVEVGSTLRRGEKINEGPETDESSRAPVSGVVQSIRFDPERHEFVLVIVPAD
jgi:Na+-translocating ferredoxin:NAD+ oxidoreductase RnfC subunit